MARRVSLPILFVAAIFAMVSCTRAQQTPAHTEEGAQPTGCDLSAWVLQQQPHSTLTREDAPDQYDTSIVINGSQHIVHLQRNFKIGTFSDIPLCRGLAVSPDGVLYVTSYNGNIYALPDHDHNGIPDSVITIVSGKQEPHGLAFHDGKMYFSTSTTFEVVTATKPDRSALTTSTLLSGFNTSDHITHTFVFDTVRKKILMQFGSACNFCDNRDSLGVIREYNYDMSGARTYARGLRNAVGMDLDPRTNALWTNVNGMDDLYGRSSVLHNSIPPEGVYLVCDGANYGWPYAYGFRMRNPDSGYQIDTSYIEKLSGPVAEILAHSAPLGLHFYRGTTLPAKYHNAIFMAYHGSWNASPPSPPRVTVMWADSNGRNAHVQDFLTGFQLANGSRWEKTVEVIEGADSALYVSMEDPDPGFLTGGILRITYAGPTSSVSIDQQKRARLTLGLASPNPFKGSTTIKYSADASAPLSIKLLDILGKEVRDLSPAHANEAVIDRKITIERKGLSAGVYFLRATLGSESQTLRLVLEK